MAGVRNGVTKGTTFGELTIANKGTTGLKASLRRLEIKRRANRLVNAWDAWGQLGLSFGYLG